MGPQCSSRNVLIVEDDDDLRRFLYSRLVEDPRSGLLWEATDPLTVGALAQFLPVDVVILNYYLAQGTATDCLADVRRHRPDARILVYTSDLQAARDAHVLDLGADHLIEQTSVTDGDAASIVFGGRSPAAIPVGI